MRMQAFARSSQQLDSRLDDLDYRIAFHQIQRLVQHLIHMSAVIRHTGERQYRLLPQILRFDLGDRQIEPLPESIFQTRKYLALVFQGLTVGQE